MIESEHEYPISKDIGSFVGDVDVRGSFAESVIGTLPIEDKIRTYVG